MLYLNLSLRIFFILSVFVTNEIITKVAHPFQEDIMFRNFDGCIIFWSDGYYF